VVDSTHANSHSRPLKPDRYDFTVGKVDLGERGSALVREVSKRGFAAPVTAPVAPLGRRPPHFKPPPGQEREYELLIAGLRKGGIIKKSAARPPFYCHHFTVPKGEEELRFIFDGKTVNLCCPKPPKFRVDGVRVCKGRARHFSWAAKLDIRHCFYNIPLAEDVQKFFSIRIDKEFYSFTRLPMGFTWSSYIVARMLRATLGSLSCFVTIYADDIVVWGDSEADCAAYLREARALLLAAGWKLAEEKTHLPCQLLDILGVSFDLVSKCCRLSSDFRGSLASCMLDFSRRRRARKRDFASLYGSLQWGNTAVPSLAPLANPLLFAMHGPLGTDPGWDDWLDVGEAELACLVDLAKTVVSNPWTTIRGLRPGHARFSSDASSRFVAVDFGQSVFCRRLTPAELPLHIGDKEATALYLGMSAAFEQGRDALFLVDAKALVQGVQKGRSNNTLFNACCLLQARARVAGLAWRVQWIPTGENSADLPTRPELLPSGVTHPELLVPGVAAVVPSGWRSPLLDGFLLLGVCRLGPPQGVPGFPAPCSRVF
jgi:hypothetical protein